MPVYEVHSPEGLLSDDDRQEVTDEITRIHTTATGAPSLFVNVVFTDLPAGRTFADGKPARTSFVIGHIRQGRDVPTRQGMLHDLSDMWTRITGVGETEVILTLIDTDPATSLEYGLIFPDAGQEEQWFEENRDKLIELGIVPAS